MTSFGGAFGPVIAVISPFPLRLYLFSGGSGSRVSARVIGGHRRTSSPSSRVVFKPNLPYSRHLQPLCDYSSSLSPVWLLLPSKPPPVPHPPQTPGSYGAGAGVYGGRLWGPFRLIIAKKTHFGGFRAVSGPVGTGRLLSSRLSAA